MKKISLQYILVWIVLAGGLFVPVSGIRVGAAFLLMTVFPGVLFWSFANSDADIEYNIFLAIIAGFAFLTVLVYYCAWIVWFPIPIVVSFVCAVVLGKKKVPLPGINTKMIYLAGCIVFMGIYLYPWATSSVFYPPGDEMKIHFLHISAILKEGSLPAEYALYPEIPGIYQPLGFHGVCAWVAAASGTSFVTTGTILGIVLGALGCCSVYFLGCIYSEKIGVGACFSFAFLSFVSHQLGASGSYVVLAGLTVQVVAVAFLVKAARQRSRNMLILAGLLCAACFSIDLNSFLVVILFSGFFLVINKLLFPIAAFFICSLPQLARFSVFWPTSVELQFIREWFYQGVFTAPHEGFLILFSLGPLLCVFAALELLSWPHPKQFSILSVYGICFLIPVIISFGIPVWYFFDPVLIFRMVSIPLAVFSGVFIVNLKIDQRKYFILGLIILGMTTHMADPFQTVNELPVTADADTLEAYQWIFENTALNESICNFTSFGDSSTWIPAVCYRRVFLPFHLYSPHDNAMTQLDLPQRVIDSTILRTLPDSNFAGDILDNYGLKYVYIDKNSQVDPVPFLESSVYHLEFHTGSTYIFSVTENPPVVYEPVFYHREGILPNGLRSRIYFPRIRTGSVLGIYYLDKGHGNIDVDINGQYKGTIYRFNTFNHYVVFFVLPSPEATISIFPYQDEFSVDYLVIFERMN
ncbi:MAG: hypothetical protein PVF58_02370 [Candidatus Methanofastidiosia archaeon]